MRKKAHTPGVVSSEAKVYLSKATRVGPTFYKFQQNGTPPYSPQGVNIVPNWKNDFHYNNDRTLEVLCNKFHRKSTFQTGIVTVGVPLYHCTYLKSLDKQT